MSVHFLPLRNTCYCREFCQGEVVGNCYICNPLPTLKVILKVDHLTEVLLRVLNGLSFFLLRMCAMGLGWYALLLLTNAGEPQPCTSLVLTWTCLQHLQLHVPLCLPCLSTLNLPDRKKGVCSPGLWPHSLRAYISLFFFYSLFKM